MTERLEDALAAPPSLDRALQIVRQRLDSVMTSVEPADCVVQGHLEVAEMALEMARNLGGDE